MFVSRTVESCWQMRRKGDVIPWMRHCCASRVISSVLPMQCIRWQLVMDWSSLMALQSELHLNTYNPLPNYWLYLIIHHCDIYRFHLLSSCWFYVGKITDVGNPNLKSKVCNHCDIFHQVVIASHSLSAFSFA